MGITGIGYGAFYGYSMSGYPTVPNSAPAAATAGTAGTAGAVAAAGAGATAAGAGARQPGAPGASAADGTSTGKGYTAAELQNMKRAGKVECQTCKSRTYQDGSNDPGVSFKAPGYIDPAASGAVVMGHEQEHVSNEQARARSEGRRVVAQSVRLFTAVCPECGRAYVAGGETRTTTAGDSSRNQTNPYKQSGGTAGKSFDMSV